MHIGTDSEEYMGFSALGLIRGKHPVCAGRVFFSRSHVLASINKMKRILIFAAFIAIILVSIIGVIFSRIVSKPVEELKKGARKIEKGDFSHNVPVRTKDELGSLARTFNEMSLIINNKITELESKNQELSMMDKLKDEFLANTSHELRTPIHGIIGIADSLKLGAYGPLAEEININLSLIVKSGNRLSRLVDDILDYSRLKHHDIDLKQVEVDLGSLTEVVISMVKPLARNKYLLLQNKIIPGEMIVFGDESRIQQVLFNLLGNAIKFTDEGEVSVNAEISSDNNNLVIITVKDTGIGIPAEKIRDIFESFRQIDGSNTRNYGGTGLGLTIARDLVHLHGGDIWVESEIGEGSEFFFTLPRVAVEDRVIRSDNPNEAAIEPVYQTAIQNEAEFVSPVNTGKQSKANFRVLVVDDEDVNLQVLANYLSFEGYSVSLAISGVEAIDIIEKEGIPDIILLDVMMPVMSGYEVCRILREKYPSYQLPVLMLTAKNRAQDLAAGFEAGANDYISKPFDKRELMTRVKNLVNLKQNVQYYNELSILKEELTIAQQIQESIIPISDPEIPGFNIKSKYVPMTMVGGDFFDFYRSPDDEILGIIIADVTGHGIPAALIASMLKAAFALSREIAPEPSSMLENLNSVLYNHISSRFVTACYGMFDKKKMILTISSAAHWPIYLYRRGDGTLQELRTKGTLMGLNKTAKYHNSEYQLLSGDRVIFITDGIIEERNPEGDIFGEQRFRKYIHSSIDSAPEVFPDDLLSELKEWAGVRNDGAFEDDISIIVVDVL